MDVKTLHKDAARLALGAFLILQPKQDPAVLLDELLNTDRSLDMNLSDWLKFYEFEAKVKPLFIGLTVEQAKHTIGVLHTTMYDHFKPLVVALEDPREARYVKKAGQYCPCCGSDELDVTEAAQIDGSVCLQETRCESCRSTWKDQYKLVGYQDLEEGEDL